MAVYLSPRFNEQQIDANGNPYNGGKLYTYAAGSSTPLTSYTSSTGLTPQANPIILNSRGQVDNDIWLTGGRSYKFALYDVNDVLVRTEDNISGINDASITVDQWVASGLTPTYVSATQFTLAGDQTSTFTVNRRLKFTVTAGTVYGTITASAFAALTTVTVALDSGVLDSGLSAVQLGLITPTNTSLPNIPDFITSTSLSTSTYSYGDIVNTTFVAPMASNAVTVSLKTYAGTDPTAQSPAEITFRSATLGTGGFVKRAVTAALSTVISSGSTGGTVNAIKSRIMVLAIDNAGTVELAWCNAAGANFLDESTVISTTAEGGAGAADSASVIYSTTARSNVAFRILGFFESTQATAGTWVTAASTIQPVGGESSLSKSLQGVLYAPIATTSGTSWTFSNIPSWAKEIEVMFSGFSTSGTSVPIVQLNGTSSGYAGTTLNSGAVVAYPASGFPLDSSHGAAFVLNGVMSLKLMDAANGIWVNTANIGRSDTAQAYISGGIKTLSALLTSIVITTVGGADTGDAGSVSILVK